MHYYKFNISDYKAHTEHLELLEDLAFRRMLDWMYLHEKPLPKEVNEIARFIRMRTHCDCITNVLHEYFTKTKGGFINERVGKELGNFQKKSALAKKSAEARWKKNTSKNNDLPDANALQTQCDSDANGMLNTKHKTLNTKQETLNNKKKLKQDANVLNNRIIDDVFEFWLTTFSKMGSAKLTVGRKKNILARIKEGYSLDDMKLAITGCSKSEYHMGQNDNGKIYDSLELILRNGEKLENFIACNTKVIQKVNPNAANQSNNQQGNSTRRRVRESSTTKRVWDVQSEGN